MISSRREFFLQVGALMAVRSDRPDLILHHANVVTVEQAMPRAEAIAIARDRIVAVGSNAEVRALAGPQ
ncbi:MAG TPA: amidohydrolase, partial [Thermoanaerobaculia bacterium]